MVFLRNHRVYSILILLLIVITIPAIGCITIVVPQPSESPTITTPDSNPSPNAPAQQCQAIEVTSFIADPPNIISGDSSRLTWNVTGATAVSIDQGIGSVGLNGEIIVSPSETTIYKLTASNTQNTTIAATQVIVASVAPPSAPLVLPLPVIVYFSAEPQNIMEGESLILSWNVLNADLVTINPVLYRQMSDIPSNGSASISPSVNTTYTLIATNSAGSISKTVNVAVNPISASPQYADWSGTWKTDWGTMKLVQSYGKVTGTYVYDQGKIIGYISKNMTGDILIGTWSEAPSYSPPQDAGDFEFIMAPGFNSFSGKWRYGSSGGWDGSWVGTRLNP